MPGFRAAGTKVTLGMEHAPFAAPGAMAAERLLLDEVARAQRAPTGRLALALHLSRLKPPAPRPHHARIARALLEDAAMRHGGQVFSLRNGDAVLLCAPGAEGARRGSTPDELPFVFARLFGADAPPAAKLCTLWHLAHEGGALRAFLTARLQDPAPPAAEAEAEIPASVPVAAMESLIDHMSLDTALAQQTAVRVTGSTPMPLAARIVPVHHELTLSLAGTAQVPGLRDAVADPFLFRHFAARLDRRMLALLQADFTQRGRLCRLAQRSRLPLHINLTLDGIASPAFTSLAEAARQGGIRLGVEVALVEAAADAALMETARQALRAAGCALVLDGVDHAALLLTHPAGLQPDLIKLLWSPRLGEGGAALDAALRRLGPARLVLHRTDTEAALAWGRSRGIGQFQGVFMDAVQAASRIAVCHSARPCTLRLCMQRAAAHDPALRSGCGNPALLDMSAAGLAASAA